MTDKLIDGAVRGFYVLLGAAAVALSVLITVAIGFVLVTICKLCGVYLGVWAA